MSDGTMYDYYREKDIFPTHGGFRSEEDLQRHEQHRRELFVDKLKLPTRVFAGASLLEFGPDTGENSLVFARWGAACTLAEPNGRAHDVIRSYFDQFSLRERLIALSDKDLRSYAAAPDDGRRFDFVIAEGFIYTVRPVSMWAELLARVLAPGGMAVLFYVEPFGSFFELVLKVIHSRYTALTGADAVVAARALFQAKWNSIPHRRPLEAFTMDVLKNPFVRLRHLLESRYLCEQLEHAGLALYSSWPVYEDTLQVRWFKRARTPAERLGETDAFLRCSRLSHIFGFKLFVADASAELDGELMALLELADGLIDEFRAESVEPFQRLLERVDAVLASERIVAPPENVARARSTLSMLVRLFRLLAEGDAGKIAEFCTRDDVFVATWGTSSHFAVFRKA